MRILHVVPTYYPAVRYGGPIRSVHELARAQAARGHDVHVFTTNVDGPGVSNTELGVPVDLDGVRVWYFPTGAGRRIYRSPQMGAALKAHMAEFDVAHVHSVFLWPTIAAAAAARSADIPYVLTPRGMLVRELIRRKSRLAKSVWMRVFEARNLAHAAAVHMTTNVEAEDFRRLSLGARRLVVIPNGIDPPQDRETNHVNAGNGAACPKVLFLGRISWKKGLDRLIPAIARVRGVELVIAGNDEERYQRKLEQLAREHAVAERVRFVGPVDGREKWALLASAAVFILPSYSENFGIAVLEAMAVGCPVVVTREVGLSEAVEEARAGIVNDGSPEALALAIRTLVGSPELRAKMGAAGRRTAAERFSWPTIAARMEQVYIECIDRQKQRLSAVK